jgi:hypothetical protein
MSKNGAIIRSGYPAAEGGVNDVKTFVSLFTADGVILDVALGELSNLGAVLTQQREFRGP